MVNHISLDFWNTIMVSNKKFSELRLDYLKNEHLPNISINELNYNIEKIGDSSDRVNMSKGISIPSVEMYKSFFLNFGVKLDEVQANKIYNDLEKIFLRYPPILLYNIGELKNSFRILKAQGNTLSISSNTAYIKGNTLKKILEHYGLIKYFDFLIFSDEINSSKPALKFFQKLEESCKKMNITKDNILHIGDSFEADIIGARLSKIKSRLIDYKKESLIDVLSLI
jgi:putative hydrolase of the HAD superfamily